MNTYTKIRKITLFVLHGTFLYSNHWPRQNRAHEGKKMKEASAYILYVAIESRLLEYRALPPRPAQHKRIPRRSTELCTFKLQGATMSHTIGHAVEFGFASVMLVKLTVVQWHCRAGRCTSNLGHCPRTINEPQKRQKKK